MTPELENRLYNWKFNSAAEMVSADDELRPDQYALIEALSVTFGNSGWFGGHMGEIVKAAVESLGVADDEVATATSHTGPLS